MNFFNKSGVLFLTGALLCVALACVRADEAASQDPADDVFANDEPEGTLKSILLNAGKAFNKKVQYLFSISEDDGEEVLVRYRESQSPISEEQSQQIAKWIQTFKTILVDFVASITAPDFNKDASLDEAIATLSEALKSATAEVVGSELYKSNKDVQQQVKDAFALLGASRGVMTREREYNVQGEVISMEDLNVWADILTETFTKVCKPEWTCSLASIRIGEWPLIKILRWNEDLIAHNGLEKAVDGLKKVASSIVATL